MTVMKKSGQLMMGAVHAQEYRQEFDQTYYRQVDNGDQVYAYRYICIVYLHIFKKTATMSRRQRPCQEDGDHVKKTALFKKMHGIATIKSESMQGRICMRVQYLQEYCDHVVHNAPPAVDTSSEPPGISPDMLQAG